MNLGPRVLSAPAELLERLPRGGDRRISVRVVEHQGDALPRIGTPAHAIERAKLVQRRDQQEVPLEHEAEPVTGEDVLEQLVPRHVRRLHRQMRRAGVEAVRTVSLDIGMDDVVHLPFL
jgi:hypothetical protein